MSKSQQKQTYNAAQTATQTDLANAASSLGTANNDITAAGNAYNAIDPSKTLAPASAAAGGIASTGGYAQPQLSQLEGAEASNLGGLDPSALSALSGQYQNLISSGGISDATQAAMQRQAVSGVGSIYGTLSQQQQRNRAVTGGQGGGGETAEMARQLASSEANAITGVNSSVGQLRQQGTEAGLAGASNLTASQAAAQNAAANTYSGTQANVAGGLQTGANLLSGIGATELSGQLAGAGGLTNVAGLQSGLYGTQLGAAQGTLGTQGNIANAQQGAFGNILKGVGAISQLGNTSANLIAAGSGCWIAEATYGILNPKTFIARTWVNEILANHFIGKYIFQLYLKFGKQIAHQIYEHSFLKHLFKPLFDLIPGVKNVNS